MIEIKDAELAIQTRKTQLEEVTAEIDAESSDKANQ